jgi:hypothetical protein
MKLVLTKVKTKWNEDAVSHFMTRLIDYAGLFPPASLSLQEAISNYHFYIREINQWMVRSFVIPVTRLHELEPYLALFNKQYPLRLAVILTKSADLESELKAIKHFLSTFHPVGTIEAIEIPLPSDVELEYLRKLEIETEDFPIYCEVSGSKIQIQHTLDLIQSVNKQSHKQLGVKMRTGGIKANLFPTADKVAFVIHECQKRQLMLKFTAGLHHPIRQYRDEVETKMHGFINVFTAALLAYNYPIDLNTLEMILLDEDPTHFSFTPKELRWWDLSVHSEEIYKARSFFAHSYGSCSLDEPLEELGDLSIFREENEK